MLTIDQMYCQCTMPEWNDISLSIYKRFSEECLVDYIKSKIINGKGVHLGMRYEEEVYVPLTMLVDRAVNPDKSLEGLDKIEVRKLEIIESGKIIETIEYK